MASGKLLILSGPSGVGKDAVIDAWRRRNSRVTRVVSYTTRAPRPNEIDGIDYHFVTVERFLEHAAAGDFLEYKQVHEHHYATPLKDMEALLRNGDIAVLKIDVQGALAAMELRPDADSVFIMPPSIEELRRRIRHRGTEDSNTIELRLKNAEGELEMADRYRHRIVNDTIEGTVDQLEKLVGESD